MVDHTVWLPTNSAGAPVRSALGVDAGAVVGFRKADLELEAVDLVDISATTQDGVQ